MQQVTLSPGDYVATEGMTDPANWWVGDKLEYSPQRNRPYPLTVGRIYAIEGFDLEGTPWVRGDDFYLYVMILEDFRFHSRPNTNKETDMHITDKLYKARKERDMAQAQYEQALAEHRAAYPWMIIEEREEQPNEDMTDPANWRAGDWLKCERSGNDLTPGKLYQVLDMDGEDDPVIDDDEESNIPRHAYYFRFHSRPQK